MPRLEPKQTGTTRPGIIGELGPFLLVRKLGSGGMGTVYIVRAPWPDHPVAALKRGLFGEEISFEQRFRHEMALAVRLDHPNLIKAFDVGSIGGEPYVCSELILGKDLGAITKSLDRNRVVGPFGVALSIMIDVLRALHYVHNARESDGSPLALVHRDVKPGNIIIGYDGVSRLADFGAATSALTRDMQLTKPGEVVGTPWTVAPDALRSEPATPASDIYALGTVVYRLVAGIHPHEAASTRDVLLNVLHGEARPLARYRADLPQWFIDLVHRMLANDARVRPSSADILRTLGARRTIPDGLPDLSKETVRRWLLALFKDVYDTEMREYEEIQQLTLEESYAVARTNTYARRGTDPRIEAGKLDDPTVRAEPEWLAASSAVVNIVDDDAGETSPGVALPDLLGGSVTEPHEGLAAVAAKIVGRADSGESDPAYDPFSAETTVPAQSTKAETDVHERVHAQLDPASTQAGLIEVRPVTSDLEGDTDIGREIERPEPSPPPEILQPASASPSIESSLDTPVRRISVLSIRNKWATLLVIIAGVTIGLSTFAVVHTLLNGNITAIVTPDPTPPVASEVREELNRRRVEMRARVRDGETFSQEAWLTLDRVSSNIEAGDGVAAKRALAELAAMIKKRTGD